ncbi:hypothetical protein [Dactylosporangium cerinum]
MTSYDVFNPDANCADARGPANANGLDQSSITLLSNRNAALNDVLLSGAHKYKFSTATARLAPLCSPDSDRLGADIQGLDGSNPFHPTGVGSIRMASAVVQEIRPDAGV